MSTYPSIYWRVPTAIRPLQTAALQAILRDQDLVGGYRVVDTIAQRDAIPEWSQQVEDFMPGSNYRRIGMLVHVVDEAKTYRLKDGLTNEHWVEVDVSVAGVSMLSHEDNIPDPNSNPRPGVYYQPMCY